MNELIEPHEPLTDCDCHRCAIEERDRLRIVENRAELLAEDIEVLHMNLDATGVPRNDEYGNTLSLWGRVLRFKYMTPNVELRGAPMARPSDRRERT